MKKKILAINVHPNLNGLWTKGDINKSFANKIIMNELANYPEVTTHTLAEAYPAYKLDVKKEQNLLLEHDTILIIGPIYWYSLPALAKLWIDEVLLYGWAYGSNGKQLKNKKIQLVLTSGSVKEEYSAEEIGNTLEELFIPFRKTFEYCSMTWLPIKFIGGLSSKNVETKRPAITKQLVDFTNKLTKSHFNEL